MILDLHRRGIELELRVALPATVTAWHEATESEYGPLPAMVSVQPDLKAARLGHKGDAQEGETFKAVPGTLSGKGELVMEYPTFTVPVFYPGLADMWIRGKLEAGEQGLLIMSDRALGRWLVAGRADGNPVDPGDGATHGENLCDAFFLPGLRSGPLFPVDVPSDGTKIGAQDGSANLYIKSAEMRLETTKTTLVLDAATEIQIGDGATSFAAKADLVDQELTDLKTQITAIPNAADPAGAVAAVNAILAVFKTSWNPGSVAASVAKVK